VRLTKDGRPLLARRLGDQLAYALAPRYGRVQRFGADDLTATLGKNHRRCAVILLAHEPYIATRVPARVALQLSGHTHAARSACSVGRRRSAAAWLRLAYGHSG